MNATEPTYFLYSGRLFHEAALPALRAQLQRRGEDAAGAESLLHTGEAPSSTPQPRSEDPSPEGPEGEPVGEEDEAEGEGESDKGTQGDKNAESKPLPGPGAPVVPEHGSPDANPIDPRVF